MDEFEKWWAGFEPKNDIGSGFIYGAVRRGAMAGYKAGLEAGMREAAAVCKLMAEKYRSADMLDCSGYILSAIGGDK